MNDCTLAYYADFYLKKKKKNEKYVMFQNHSLTDRWEGICCLLYKKTLRTINLLVHLFLHVYYLPLKSLKINNNWSCPIEYFSKEKWYATPLPFCWFSTWNLHKINVIKIIKRVKHGSIRYSWHSVIKYQ